MQISNSFNAAAGADAPAASQGNSGPSSSGGSHQTTEGATASTSQASTSLAPEQAVPMVPPDQMGASPSEASPNPALLNAIQDRQFDELGQFHTARYHGRERMLADFDRRFGERERQLQREIDEQRDLLNNSGPARLFWLKLTRQIAADPAKNLEAKQNEWQLIQHDREAANWNFDRARDEELSALRERHVAERQSRAPDPARQTISHKFNQAVKEPAQPDARTANDRKAKPADPRQERLEVLEDQRARLELDLEMPAPKNAATAVNKHVEEQLAIEISKLKAKLEIEQDAEEEAELDEDY
jgi:hypothetical protein